jgi:hypothetical protein
MATTKVQDEVVVELRALRFAVDRNTAVLVAAQKQFYSFKELGERWGMSARQAADELCAEGLYAPKRGVRAVIALCVVMEHERRIAGRAADEAKEA